MQPSYFTLLVIFILRYSTASSQATAKYVPELEYDTVRQTEQYVFCLPIPKRIFKEDFGKEDYPGKRVYLSMNNNSLIVYQCFIIMDNTPWEKIYQRDAESIRKRLKLSKFIKQKLGKDYYILSYQKGNRLIYIKKWLLKGHDNILTTQFEYPADQQALFDQIIKKVTGFDPSICK